MLTGRQSHPRVEHKNIELGGKKCEVAAHKNSFDVSTYSLVDSYILQSAAQAMTMSLSQLVCSIGPFDQTLVFAVTI